MIKTYLHGRFIGTIILAVTIGLVALLSCPVIAAPLATQTNNTAASHNNVFQSPLFSIGAYGDKTLGFIAEVRLASYIGDSQRYAGALEINAGPKIFRANATYGFDTTDNQRLKLTFDRLQQKLDFDFVTGTTSTWVGQNAIGAAYAFLFDNPYIESFDVGGYYAHSSSKTLSEQDIVFDPDLTIETADYRRIAGADAGNVHADIVLRLWPYSRLRGGIDYDSVKFDTKNRHGKDINGAGGHVQLEQRLLPQLKAKFRTRLQQTQREYMGSVGWLLPSPKGMQLELEAITDYVDSRATAHDFFTSGGRLNISLSPSTGVYSDFARQQQQNLLSWTQEPAVRMTEVLAIADGNAFDYIRPLTTQELINSGQPVVGFNFGGWQAAFGNAAFDFNNAIFLGAAFLPSVSNGTAFYYDSSQDLYFLIIRTDVSGVIGDSWGDSEINPPHTAGANAAMGTIANNYCNAINEPDRCRFKPD